MVGHKFGRLTVLRVAVAAGANTMLECRCECGGTRTARHQSIRAGSTASCGCLHREAMVAKRVHGMTRTPDYIVWSNMIARCEYPRNDHYDRYGGRGITVCARWRESFAIFIADMGPRPSPHHSLDRIDNDANYEPGNCRWATRSEQARNTSRNRRLTVHGETMVLEDWARRIGVPPDNITSRLLRGWSAADAVLKPFRKMQRRSQ